MTNRFQGDPLLVMTVDGVDMPFTSGQPVMDQGFTNQVNISLFTLEGWFGNKLIPNEENQVGSDFQEITQGPITLSLLSDVEKSAEKALASSAFGDVESLASNPSSQRLNVLNKITPPGQDSFELAATRNSGNWIAQATNPAQ